MFSIPSADPRDWPRTKMDGFLRCPECGAVVCNQFTNKYDTDIPVHIEWHIKIATAMEDTNIKLSDFENKISMLDSKIIDRITAQMKSK